MGRRKIEIKAIKDDRNRSVTFLKRKGGLFKKAHELAVLCSVDVAVIIFGHNKKLYEFSSCDMPETCCNLCSTQFGPPHEHKGPEDFSGKRDADDDDEDETTPAPEDDPSRSRTHSVVPPSLQLRPGFQHINQAPSASPPVTNGMAFAPRVTPQPQILSRPTSRNHIRRVSSNLASHHQHRATPPPPPPQNGFAYMPSNPPPIYNPNPAAGLTPHPPRPGQYPHFTHPPPAPQLQPPHPQSIQPHHHHHASPMPPQSILARHQPTPPHIPPQHAPPNHGLPQIGISQPHPHMPQMAQVYLPEHRSPMPPAVSSEPPQPRAAPLPDTSPSDQVPVPARSSDESQSSKSRSIFTPIDDRGSVLARHFGIGAPTSEYARTTAPPHASGALPAVPTVPPPTRAKTIPAVPELKPPMRTNSGPISARPKLTVQIPSENSDRGSATAESSTRDSPPSPSAGAILSAGAQGPPNPFARPPPPATTTAQNNNTNNNNNTSSNNNNNGNINNIETPMSALPSRFMADALLPSPSSFFPEWGFGRTGPDSNMLPSPLTFPTPSGATGPSFSRDDETERKRKNNEDTNSNQEAISKRVKT